MLTTPSFFINGRRYDGAWDESSFRDAMLGSLGHRVRVAALDFAGWAPSAGLLLLLATVLAILLTNSPFGPGFEGFWHHEAGIVVGGFEFRLSLLHWVNDAAADGVLPGGRARDQARVHRRATSRAARAAALPVAAAVGGMLAPALIYAALIPAGPWAHGWGVPMATDTAFAVALIAMMGARVPVELRIFLTAAAIVDDIGAIVVVALFYSGELHPAYFAAAAAIVGLLALLNRWHVYSVTPYSLLGIALWFTVHEAGLHATLAGVLLALFIPTRPPANLPALVSQANAILNAEARRSGEVLHAGPSLPALRTLDAIHDRLESPADRLLRHAGARSSYLVLPVFALANAGVALTPGGGRGPRDPAPRDRRRARGRQAARARRALGARGAARAGGEARRLFLAAARRRGVPRGHRLHHVAVHRRAGVRRSGRLRGGEARGLRRLGRRGARRGRRPLARAGARGAARGGSGRVAGVAPALRGAGSR